MFLRCSSDVSFTIKHFSQLLSRRKKPERRAEAEEEYGGGTVREKVERKSGRESGGTESEQWRKKCR